MRLALPVLAIGLMSILPAPSEARAAPDGQYGPTSSSITTIQVGQRDRICCKRGSQDWWASRRQCQRAGGTRVNNRACRSEWNERWDVRWWNWSDRGWNERVCCKRGNRDWWTTAAECRNAFGYQTANRACRR